MLKNIDQGDLRGHGRRKDFSGGALGDSSKIFLGGPKVVKFLFSLSKLRKQSFLQKIFKIQNFCKNFQNTDAHVRGFNMVNIHNPLTALLG